MFTEVPRVPRIALRTVDCCESKVARNDPMEKPASGVTAAMEVRVTD